MYELDHPPRVYSPTHPASPYVSLSSLQPVTLKEKIQQQIQNYENENGGRKSMFFFDVDNTLYDENKGIQKAVGERIIRYFAKIGLNDPKVAHDLSQKYYLQYGLSVRGLIKHHQVDPVDYDKFVDGGLPLEELLTPSQELKDILSRLKTDRWIFTNAGHLHARRVLSNLEITDQFSGMTYCDYAHEDFHCKPEEEFFKIALRDAKVTDDTKCYFVDDSKLNCEKAKSLGWTVVHITPNPETSNCADFAIKRVTELPSVLPQLFDTDDKINT